MVVPQRIKTIGDFIESGDVVVDVGADHGLLEVYLIAKYPNITITAVENKIGPYKILERNLKAYKNIRLSLSDGLESVGKTTRTVVLAGMGGLNIKNILDAYPKKTKNLQKIIIDAHRDLNIARETILNYGFKINREKIVYEQDKFYVVTEFIKTETTIEQNADLIDIGYKLYEDELWPKYKEYLLLQNNITIEKIKDIESMQDKVLSLKKMNERLENYGKN